MITKLPSLPSPSPCIDLSGNIPVWEGGGRLAVAGGREGVEGGLASNNQIIYCQQIVLVGWWLIDLNLVTMVTKVWE